MLTSVTICQQKAAIGQHAWNRSCYLRRVNHQTYAVSRALRQLSVNAPHGSCQGRHRLIGMLGLRVFAH